MKMHSNLRRVIRPSLFAAVICLLMAGIFFRQPQILRAQQQKIVWTDQEQPISDKIRGLRDLPDDVRARTTKALAIDIRQLPVTQNKLRLAYQLATLSTEGDFGHDMLQEVADTLAGALRESPIASKNGQPPEPYVELASLARFEHVNAALDDPQYAAALAKLDADDAQRQTANFTLTDLRGNSWTLKDLRGKVVLVNFWATWCPPCRKEMPDLDALYKKFSKEGFVILAISDEEEDKVKPFIAERKISYPILLDPGRKVNTLFRVEGIPKSFVFDRSGKLVAQSIDMRTRNQFLELLGQAGLK
jgi:peroxiredoxin